MSSDLIFEIRKQIINKNYSEHKSLLKTFDNVLKEINDDAKFIHHNYIEKDRIYIFEDNVYYNKESILGKIINDACSKFNL